MVLVRNIEAPVGVKGVISMGIFVCIAMLIAVRVVGVIFVGNICVIILMPIGMRYICVIIVIVMARIITIIGMSWVSAIRVRVISPVIVTLIAMIGNFIIPRTALTITMELIISVLYGTWIVTPIITVPRMIHVIVYILVWNIFVGI